MEQARSLHDFAPIIATLRAYFLELDETLDALSHKNEGATTKLHPWMLSHRDVFIAYQPQMNYYVMRFSPSSDRNSSEDRYHTFILDSQDVFDAVVGDNALSIGGPGPHGLFLSGNSVRQGFNPLDAPLQQSPDCLVTATNTPHIIQEMFGAGVASSYASSCWERATSPEPATPFPMPMGPIYPSAPAEAQTVFFRFSSLVKLKSFKERRIHRFLFEHRELMLPEHTACLFEHTITAPGLVRVADFILQREFTMPALLVELESPVYQPFRKDGGDTQQLTHARAQIAEWVRIIDDERANRAGDLQFLTGPKQRLVVMGRGLDNIEQMRNSQSTDTIVWTYTMLLEEAKQRALRSLNAQRKLIGQDPLPPFKG